MDVTHHAVAVLRMFDIEPMPLDRLLERYLSRHREINSRLRRAISDAAFCVMRWRRRIDGFLISSGAAKPDDAMRVRACLRANPALEYASNSSDKGIEIPSEVFSPDLTMPGRFPGGIAAFHSFPDFLYEKLVAQYGEKGAARMACALNSQSRPSLRVNSMRTTLDEAIRMLNSAGVEAEPSGRSPYGLRLFRRITLGSVDAYSRGLVEVQDESSQLAVIAADPKEGETVLDACAGAGGKSLMIAMLMGGRGRIIASDVDSTKLRELSRRASRAGLSMIEILAAKDLCRKAHTFKGAFDLVFVDAPCTGTGTLRRSPDLKWRLNPEDVRQSVVEQKALLTRYADWVRPGGRLVYATCSILRDENENIVEDFLRSKNYRVIGVGAILARREIDTKGITAEGGYLATDPREGEWNGFFAASMQRIE